MKRHFIAVDYGSKDETAVTFGYVDGLGHLHITDVYTTDLRKEKPMKMTLLEAHTISRFGRTQGSRTRDNIRREATQMLREEAERLMAQHEKAAAPVELVDVQTYPDVFAHNLDKLWVERVFSNGSVTKALEDAKFAEQLKYTFHAGKKAGAKAEPRHEDEE